MPQNERTRMAEILLVEDNPGDVRLMREAFSEMKVPHRLTVAGTGREALQLLKREGEFASHLRPDLVLLDLRLPDMHGLDVLEVIKGDTTMRRTPVIVFSSSQNRDELARAYHLNANSYITKPVEVEDFIRVVKGVEEFWLTVVRLPKD